jgi:hypothetical protein
MKDFEKKSLKQKQKTEILQRRVILESFLKNLQEVSSSVLKETQHSFVNLEMEKSKQESKTNQK